MRKMRSSIGAASITNAQIRMCFETMYPVRLADLELVDESTAGVNAFRASLVPTDKIRK